MGEEMGSVPGNQGGAVTREALLASLAPFPRARLAMLPTPLVEAPRLSSELGGPTIFLKREDLAGLGVGGSKYRILEFTLGAALEEGADVLIASGMAQSNHPQQVVSAAARLGLPVIVLVSGAEGHVGWTGNMLLEGLGGADVRVLPSVGFDELRKAQQDLARQLRAAGRRPALVTTTREVHLRSVLAYANFIAELDQQLEEREFQPAALYVASSGPTYAGMALGTMALGTSFDVVGSSPLGLAHASITHVTGLIEEASRLLGLDLQVDQRRIHITDAYLGPGHGIATPAAVEAIKLLASTEGLLLDPVYSGKGMAALIDDIRRARLRPTEPIVFVMTGGTPALFAYADELMLGPYSEVSPA
jgi:1-aminocyclopropane-1-carboxylate deaminase/D-cysteine desulfhydrase-like pyridoxal-dependent ACC family enzyme